MAERPRDAGGLCRVGDFKGWVTLRLNIYSIEIEFYSIKTENRFLSHPLGDLGVTYALHLYRKVRGRLPIRYN